MNDTNLREIANRIIKEFPQLTDDINEAYTCMEREIANGESKTEEEDLFYWYIHKLKRELG